MFIKLLATKIVANSFFGLSNNLIIKFIFFKSKDSASSICVLVIENKATSTPDINAEKVNKSNKEKIPIVV